MSSQLSSFSKLIFFIKSMRLYQWSKNFLFFLPLIFSHQVHLDSLIILLKGFFVFGLIASSTYLINDLIDIKKDQCHPLKKYRPIANEKLKRREVYFFVIFIFSLGIYFSWKISFDFFLSTLLYFFMTNLYSLFLKKIRYIDVFILTIFYVYRLKIGSILTHTPLSYWLIIFSLFFFASLALNKRYQEVYLVDRIKETRPYKKENLEMLKIFGIGFSIVSIFVLILYVYHQQTISFYRYPWILALQIPLIAVWSWRMWKITLDGKMHYDPIIFVFQDIPSILYIILAIILLVVSS